MGGFGLVPEPFEPEVWTVRLPRARLHLHRVRCTIGLLDQNSLASYAREVVDDAKNTWTCPTGGSCIRDNVFGPDRRGASTCGVVDNSCSRAGRSCSAGPMAALSVGGRRSWLRHGPATGVQPALPHGARRSRLRHGPAAGVRLTGRERLDHEIEPPLMAVSAAVLGGGACGCAAFAPRPLQRRLARSKLVWVICPRGVDDAKNT